MRLFKGVKEMVVKGEKRGAERVLERGEGAKEM